MQVAVKICGTDAHGRRFEEEASTLAINAHGALILLQARLTSGRKSSNAAWCFLARCEGDRGRSGSNFPNRDRHSGA